MAPEIPKYDEFCKGLHLKIHQHLRGQTELGFDFVPCGALVEFINDEVLRSFFGAIWQVRSFETDFVEMALANKLQAFVATLVYSSCSAESARSFARRVVGNRWGTSGTHSGAPSLPMDRQQLREILENETDTNKFYSHQSRFCAVILEKGQEISFKKGSRRLPYLEEEPLGNGSSGKVYKVLIAKGHLKDRSGFSFTDGDISLARKDFTISKTSPNQGIEERKVMDAILLGSAYQKSQNIVKSYGSIKMGVDYSVFMPLALSDLKNYMMEIHPTKAITLKERADILRCAAGLAEGLRFLHHEMQTEDFEELVCYHMDLKPDNILIFQREDQTGLIWKISDFGMSRIKTIRRANEKGGRKVEKTFGGWFERKRLLVSSASPTNSRRSYGTYLSPEASASGKIVSRKNDVWALGCILSEVMSYLEDGKNGVEQYRNFRTEKDKLTDRFFLPTGGFQSSTQVNPNIRKWHSELVKRVRKRSQDEAQVVERFLAFLDSSVFKIMPEKRCYANELSLKLQDTFKDYRKLVDGVKPDQITEQGVLPSRPSALAMRLFGGRVLKSGEPEEALAPSATTWSLNCPESFKGCAISPNTAILAYWTDLKIVVFSIKSQPFVNKTNQLTPSGEYSLKNGKYLWKSITLTERYLVAIASRSKYCYIFDLYEGDGENILQEPYLIPLYAFEVYHVAISASEHQVAFIVQKEPDTTSNASLMHCSIPKLIQIAKARLNVSRGLGQNTTHVATEIPGEIGVFRIGYLATNVHQLVLPSPKKACLVIQPGVSANTQEQRIRITSIPLFGESRTKSVDIESSKGFHHVARGFYTCFCPLLEGNLCAVVTRETSLQLISFNDQANDFDREFDEYKIGTLIATKHRTKLYAIGTASASSKVFLLELLIREKDVQVRKVEQLRGIYHNDDMVAVLSRDEQHVLVAALLEPNRRSIWSISI